jgi:membrane associated rhomboid family serine protease
VAPGIRRAGGGVIPLKDENPIQSPPIFTVVLIVTNVFAFLWQISLGPDQDYGVRRWGLTPIELRGMFEYGHGGLNLQPPLTIFTSMFLHGGFMHLAGNMLFLWVFGNNVEDTLGHLRFIVFYFLTGAIAALAQVYTTGDPTVAMIGASGAVSGILGAYLRLHPHARIVTLVPLVFYFTIIRVPAYFFLIVWFLGNLLSGAATYGAQGGGVAFFAHVAGFLAGVVLIRPFRYSLPERYSSPGVG